MAKKPRKQPINDDRRLQRELFDDLRQELRDLHELSLIVLSDQGVLPPLYGGEHLDIDREVIPLWAVSDDGPELGALLLRVSEGIEPNVELQALREELELSNSWPIAELLEMMVTPDGQPIVDGADEIKDLSILLILMGNQIDPAPGYDRETMFEFIAEMKPYAIFPIIPVTGEGETADYHWENLEDFRAEVVYADSPQLLEAAVWEYRLNRMLKQDIEDMRTEGQNPEELLIGINAAEMGAYYDRFIMHGIRFYGTTSAIRAKQQELDILREESGDLIIKGPLKPEVEPISLMAQARSDVIPAPDGMILYVGSETEAMHLVWPQVRAKKFFCIRLRRGIYRPTKNGQLKLNGYNPTPILEWLVADALPDLYRQVRLASIYEMLSACGLVEHRVKFGNVPAEEM
jgi:hypothetical protein